MPKADSTRTYTLANTQPVDSPDKLVSWWARDTVSIRYYPYKVMRVSRELTAGLDILCFKLANNLALPDFKVELTRQYTHVWPDLPSTIQRATANNLYGFLMLSEAWEKDAQNQLAQTPQFSDVQISALREGGEKWPLAAKRPSPFREPQDSIGLQRLFDSIFTLIR
jgi:hypothetical protein